MSLMFIQLQIYVKIPLQNYPYLFYSLNRSNSGQSTVNWFNRDKMVSLNCFSKLGLLTIEMEFGKGLTNCWLTLYNDQATSEIKIQRLGNVQVLYIT